MIYIVTIIFIIIAALQIPYYIKQRLFKELAVYSTIMAIALLYSYSKIAGWNIPGPTSVTEFIFEPVSRIVFGRFNE